MLTELVRGRSEFDLVNRVIPGVGHHRDAPDLLTPTGRIIQTHELHSDRGNRTIYLVRDVRDVALSEYAATQRAGATWSFDEFLEAFLGGRLDAFGPWHAHVLAWLEGRAARTGALLCLRYEELRAQPELQLAQVASFLGLEATQDGIREAVDANEIERMRGKELRAPPGTFVKRRPDMTFVRKGRTGGWRDELTSDQVRRIHSVAGLAMARAGYRWA
jgi:hypothetical protein